MKEAGRGGVLGRRDGAGGETCGPAGEAERYCGFFSRYRPIAARAPTSDQNRTDEKNRSDVDRWVTRVLRRGQCFKFSHRPFALIMLDPFKCIWYIAMIWQCGWQNMCSSHSIMFIVHFLKPVATHRYVASLYIYHTSFGQVFGLTLLIKAKFRWWIAVLFYLHNCF